jgi:hypothetical protein
MPVPVHVTLFLYKTVSDATHVSPVLLLTVTFIPVSNWGRKKKP